MAEEKSILTYKGKPLMRKDNVVYYGSMADSHIVMLQILETKKVNGDVYKRQLSYLRFKKFFLHPHSGSRRTNRKDP